MKAKVLKSYPDKVTNRWYKKDEIVDFEEKRIKELTRKGILEVFRAKETKNNKEQENFND